jgi:hypothetical protein
MMQEYEPLVIIKEPEAASNKWQSEVPMINLV